MTSSNTPDTSTVKFVVAIDKAPAYLYFVQQQVCEEWGVDDLMSVDSLAQVGEASIFGDPLPSVLHIDDMATLKSFTDVLLKLETSGRIAEKLRFGLLITSSVSRTSTKKLEALATRVGGRVVAANEKQRKGIAAKMLDGLSLSRDVREFLLDYAGDSYEQLVSLVQDLGTMPTDDQLALEVSDVMVRLPLPPGAIAPWEVDLGLGTADLISTYRRVVMHSHPLVVLTVLKNKLALSLRIAGVLSTSTQQPKEAELAAMLGAPKNYGFTLAFRDAKRLGAQRLSRAMTVLIEAEDALKGGSSADADTLVEVALVRLRSLVR